MLDWWQASSQGIYSVMDYTLRGTVTTDSEGYVEVLTVPPSAYGLGGIIRQGHVHLIIRPSKADASKWDELTTQLYFCPGNNAKMISSDLYVFRYFQCWCSGSYFKLYSLNFVRSSREGNVLQAWCIPSANGGETYKDLPVLSADDSLSTKRVEWWNEKLAEFGNSKVAVGATVELVLNNKSGWF